MAEDSSNSPELFRSFEATSRPTPAATKKTPAITPQIGPAGTSSRFSISPLYLVVDRSGQMAAAILRHAFDAFARLDTSAAAKILHDDAIDDQYRGFMRKLVTYMAEDPRVISAALDYLAIASVIERIGDHATNLAELVIYIVKGADIRHMPREQIEQEALRK
ncbi:hypothetical protein F3J12_31405 [Burkholderia sp. Ax-1735]|nr:hypothetical protein [Burkholderia sp. Ap-955]NIF13933.1 hypothetical protein [Burkholderia sp. Ax-1735]NIG07047.1 hypothetical protein [Burkholderia sp. Tr-849]